MTEQNENISVSIPGANAQIYWPLAVSLMDSETRESVHSEIAPCSPQEFMDRYCAIVPAFAPWLAEYRKCC